MTESKAAPLNSKDVSKALRKVKTPRERMKLLEGLVYEIRQAGYNAGLDSGVIVGRQLP